MSSYAEAGQETNGRLAFVVPKGVKIAKFRVWETTRSKSAALEFAADVPLVEINCIHGDILIVFEHRLRLRQLAAESTRCVETGDGLCCAFRGPDGLPSRIYPARGGCLRWSSSSASSSCWRSRNSRLAPAQPVDGVLRNRGTIVAPMAEPLRIEPATPTLVSLASKTESPRFRQDLLAVHGLLAGRVLALTGQPAEAE